MDLYAVLDQVITLLQQRRKVTYNALKFQFKLDDEALAILKDELFYTHPQVEDDDGRGLVWIGEVDSSSVSSRSSSAPPTQQGTLEQEQPAQGGVSPEPPTPDAERRQLTVMFCDLADFTRLSGQLDPEDLRDVIRAYQATSAEVIERYDGYIAQHLGDGLMVYFGWPQAHEDDAQRAVHAGLGILEAMQGLNAHLEQEKDLRLTVRIGIHTGLVVVGEVGKGASQEHLALGETPNIASRIEGIAAPDTVAISAVTFQLVEGYFPCQDLGGRDLKGVAAPMHVYLVLDESGAQSRFDIISAHGLTPLVGREQEVGLLLERWQQVKEGQGQVVLLSGEAGIGKSRLSQVMKDHVAREAHTLLECRSSPYYQNTALYPITDMLQRILNWQQDDTPEVKLEKLEQTLRAYGLELDEAMPLFANLLSLPIPEDHCPPLNLSPQQQRQRTLTMIVAMVLQQTEEQPVLFILEDLHWTDPSTLELLDLLIDQVPTAAICVLLTCRPAFQPTWSSRSYLTPIVLNRFSRSQIESMAERVADNKRLPAEVLQQIVEKTDGVPLFVEEMTKAVVESGILQEVNGQYEPTGTFSSLAIPTTLQDSLMARLDRLVTAKGVAQYASVIGRQFSYGLLQAVSQLDETMLQHELQRLVEAEILYQRGLPPQVMYVFKHALIQDTAYESLLRSTRQQYHQQIAQVLVERFPDTAETQPELLAHHFTEAGLKEQAVGYWQRAGERAIQRSAHLEAMSHLNQGLTLLKTLTETEKRHRQDLELQAAFCVPLMAMTSVGAPEVGQAYARAWELCQQVGHSPHSFPVLLGLYRYHILRGEFKQGQDLEGRLMEMAHQQHDPALLLELHRRLGNKYFHLGEFRTARVHHERVIALYDPAQHHDQVFVYGWNDTGVGGLGYEAYTLWFLGFPEQALVKSYESLALAEELSHPLSLAFAHHFIARVHQHRREGRLAKEHVDKAIAISVEHGFTGRQRVGMVLKGWAMFEQGEGKEGVALMCQMLTQRRSTSVVTRAYYLALLADACGKTGKLDEALHLLDEALTVVDSGGDYEAEVHRLKGELLLQQSADNHDEAESCFQQALNVSRNQEAKSLELRAAMSLARLWQQQGKRQEAHDLLAPVYGWFTEGFDTADLKDARALLDQLT